MGVRHRGEDGKTDHTTQHSYALIDDGGGDAHGLAATLLALTEQFAAALHCSECCIYEYLPERSALRAQAIWADDLREVDRDWIGRINHLADIPDFLHVVTRREILVSYPDDALDAHAAGPESMHYWGELAALWAPIVWDGDVIGLLELTEKRKRREFSETDQGLVQRMAELAALALKNARDSRAAEARNRQLSALIDSSRAMTSTLDLDEVLDVVCRQAAEALQTQASYICEYDAEARSMIWLAHYQRDPSHGFEEPLGTMYAIEDLPQDIEVVERRRPVEARLDDPGLDPVLRRQLLDWEEASSLMVPLIVGDDMVGTLEVSETRDVRHFSEEEIALCKALGEQAAVAIRNAKLYSQLQDQKRLIEHQAVTDGLTGLANHRHFFDKLRAEVNRARRYELPLTVMMLDLDDFKSVNDRFGHPAGDRVLEKVGEILKGQLREDADLAARYGGEEFAVILPHTGGACDTEAAEAARITAERIRRAIAGASFDLPVDHGPAPVTVSIGVATLAADAVDDDALVSEADQALYRAKARGKDRVDVFCRPAQDCRPQPPGRPAQ